ncbi:MAG: YdcF family protein [Clostridia bacterium]|nr:YdcF family protein [Clostridia bacterium]
MAIRFDTRNKKPKLYNLLILTAITAIAVALLVVTDPGRHAAAACITMAAYCLLAAVILFYSFREQMKYNPYSYNTIFYFGFALFSIAVMALFIMTAVGTVRSPEVYTVNEVVHVLFGTAYTFILLTFPFIAVFSAALLISNISLIIHEGKRVVNFLGIILSLLLVGGEIFLFHFNRYVSGSQTYVMVHDLVTNILSSVYVYFECMIIGTFAAFLITSRYEPDRNADFIIILGCGIAKDGRPTPLLRGRIDRAIEFYEKQKAETNKAPVLITSGGQGPNEIISESASMKAYLVEKGIPEESIIEENRSRTTFENMKFSKAKIAESDPEGNVLFSTTNYHVFRSGLFARRVKMRAVGIGAKTKWYFWPNAAVREFVGLLTKHRLKQGLILGGMVVFYVILTLIAYR